MRRGIILLWIPVLAALCGARAASAQPIRHRVLEGMSVERGVDGWLLRIRFSAPIRYLRHAPRAHGDAVQIQLSRIDGVLEDPLPAGADESLFVPRDVPIPLQEVTIEGGVGRGAILHIRFQRSLDFRVLPADDLRSLAVALPDARRVGVRRPAPRPTPRAETAPSAPLSDLIERARLAMTAGEFERAILILTKAVSLPETPRTAEAQELLGVARERNGQTAHAVAEYQTYLERFPEGDAADRVRQRLAALVTARAPPVERTNEQQPGSRPLEVDTFGSLYSSYRQESRFDELAGEQLVDSSILTDAFVSNRIRSEHYTVRSEFSGGYQREFVDGSGRFRVSSLFVETTDHHRNLIASLGRRSRSRGGVLGRFDGVRLAHRFGGRWELSSVAGFPVQSPSANSFDDGKFFVGAALDVAQVSESLDAQIYTIYQTADGMTDRAAIGGEFRYFDDGRFLAGIVDFDTYFLSPNIAQLVGNWQVTPSLMLNALADYRNAPSLSTSNALQGQAVDDLEDLSDLFSDREIKELAEDRTARVLTLTLGGSQQLTPDLQLGFDFGTTRLAGTPDSGGVQGFDGTGFEFSYFAQLIANDLVRPRDVAVFGLRFFDGSDVDVAAAFVDYRFPITSALRLNPRLAAELRFDDDAADTFEVSPRLRVDWRFRSFVLDGEAGVEWVVPTSSGDPSGDWGYYFSAGIRYDF